MPVAERLSCPSCGTPVRAADMDLGTRLARCATCDALIRLDDAAAELPLPVPPGITVTDAPHALVLTRRWFGWKYVFLAVFCVGWNGFLVFWYAVAAAGSAPPVFFVFPLIHVAAGLFLTYSTLAGFVNRTQVTVSAGHIRVRHAPLPWRGNRDVRADALAQLFCEEHVARGRNGTTVTYSVQAVTADGRKISLARGLDARDQARFLERRLEARLGIADRRVEGELRR